MATHNANNRKTNRRKPSTNGMGAFLRAVGLLAIVAILITVGYLLWQHQVGTDKEQGRTADIRQPLPQAISSSATQPSISATAPSVTPFPQIKPGIKLALLIDDMGRTTGQVDRLKALKIPISIAVIPGLAQDRSVAELAHRSGIQVLIHLPMEALPGAYERLEGNGLKLAYHDQEIVTRLTGYRARIPQAVGANNHMGSAFTQSPEKMKTVLTFLKNNQLFFIDSVTSPRTVAFATARSLAVPTARRDVFLDNVQQDRQIRSQMLQAIRIAEKKGSALVIAHPHSQTFASLERIVPELVSRGVTFVTAGSLTHN